MIELKKVNPGWFSSVMGTGALSLALLTYSSVFEFLKILSTTLTVLSTFLYFILFALWMAKVVLHSKEAKNELLNPSITHSHGMIGISAMIVSAALIYGFSVQSFPLWCLGALLTVAFSLLVPYLLMISSRIEWAKVTPLWFIPPVGLLVIPMTSLPFLGMGGEFTRDLALFGLSSGIMLYLAMFVLFFGRALLHDPVCCRSLPTLWINLGPLAVGASVFSTVAPLFPAIAELSQLSIILYFFSLWWLGILVLQTLHYRRKRNIPFSSSWWAFIFPLSALSMASSKISTIYSFPEFTIVGEVLAFSALFVWGYVIFRHLISVISLRKDA